MSNIKQYKLLYNIIYQSKQTMLLCTIAGTPEQTEKLHCPSEKTANVLTAAVESSLRRHSASKPNTLPVQTSLVTCTSGKETRNT